MANSLNKVTLIGRLGTEPESRTIPSGSTVCNFSLATNDSKKDKNGGWEETTEWHRIVLWNNLADTATKYLKKGSKVYIEGKLQTKSYEKDGITRYVTEINGTSMILLDGRQSDSNEERNFNNNNNNNNYNSNTSSVASPEEDDDIPF